MHFFKRYRPVTARDNFLTILSIYIYLLGHAILIYKRNRYEWNACSKPLSSPCPVKYIFNFCHYFIIWNYSYNIPFDNKFETFKMNNLHTLCCTPHIQQHFDQLAAGKITSVNFSWQITLWLYTCQTSVLFRHVSSADLYPVSRG